MHNVGTVWIIPTGLYAHRPLHFYMWFTLVGLKWSSIVRLSSELHFCTTPVKHYQQHTSVLILCIHHAKYFSPVWLSLTDPLLSFSTLIIFLSILRKEIPLWTRKAGWKCHFHCVPITLHSTSPYLPHVIELTSIYLSIHNRGRYTLALYKYLFNNPQTQMWWFERKSVALSNS